MALLLEKKEAIRSCCNFPLINNLSELLENEGIPADWTYTILNYVLAVHCRLNTVDPQNAFLLRNYVFKNFAYRLRRQKRVFIVLLLFTGLRYDFDGDAMEIRGIGQYVLNKFDYAVRENTAFEPENLVALGVVYTIMADIYHANKNESVVFKLLEQKNKTRNRLREYNNYKDGLWDLLMALEKILNETSVKKKLNAKNHRNIFGLGEPMRWKTAIVFWKLNDERHPQTKIAKTWLQRIRKLESNSGEPIQ